MAPLIPLLVMAGASLLKNQQDKNQYQTQQKIQATKERWAPFTGRPGQDQKAPDQMGTMMQGLMAGAMMGQQFGGNKPVVSSNPELGAQQAALIDAKNANYTDELYQTNPHMKSSRTMYA